RHPHRVAAGWNRLHRRRRSHVRQLDEQRHHRQRTARSRRPHRRRQHLVELHASQPRLQSGESGEHWRRRTALLLRGEIRMTKHALVVAVALATAALHGQTDALPAPGFHHLHLNSMNPDKAIDFYVRSFPSTSKSTWGGLPALKSPNNVLVLFTKVDQP